MATRSTIAMRTVDGRITAVYCHWDGYPSNNGAILAEHYTDGNKIAELIGLGALSSLRPEIGEAHPFNKFELKEGQVYEEALYENWCTFYARDRGEELDVRVYNDVADWVENFDMGVEYYYLWNGKEWLVNAYQRKSVNGFPDFERVEDVLLSVDDE